MSICVSDEYHQLKKDNPWMKEVNVQSMTSAISHLDKAFQKFFRHQGGFPKFKSKHDYHQSFECPGGVKIDFKAKKIQIPKFIKTKKDGDNRIKFVLSKRVKKGKIGTATISKNPSGQYFISFIVHTNDQPKQVIKDSKISASNSLGFDFGLKHFLTLSDGRVIDSPEFFKKALAKLK